MKGLTRWHLIFMYVTAPAPLGRKPLILTQDDTHTHQHIQAKTTDFRGTNTNTAKPLIAEKCQMCWGAPESADGAKKILTDGGNRLNPPLFVSRTFVWNVTANTVQLIHFLQKVFLWRWLKTTWQWNRDTRVEINGRRDTLVYLFLTRMIHLQTCKKWNLETNVLQGIFSMIFICILPPCTPQFKWQ